MVVEEAMEGLVWRLVVVVQTVVTGTCSVVQAGLGLYHLQLAGHAFPNWSGVLGLEGGGALDLLSSLSTALELHALQNVLSTTLTSAVTVKQCTADDRVLLPQAIITQTTKLAK